MSSQREKLDEIARRLEPYKEMLTIELEHPHLGLAELLSIQPLDTPAGIIFYLDVQYSGIEQIQ